MPTTVPVSFRVSPEEHAHIHAEAKAAGLTLSDYVRATLGLVHTTSTPTSVHNHTLLSARLDAVERQLGLDPAQALDRAREALSGAQEDDS